MRAAVVIVLLLLSTIGGAAAPESAAAADRRKLLDEVLDTYVRDGMVYYRALKTDRAKLDRYVGAIANVSINSVPREEQLAFWLNAYNALVLRTVIDHYPIPLRSKDYPPRSIRQIPGAFERAEHRVGGRLVTLDALEQTILPAFNDPRVYLALGRGSIGGGRLRSEAYAPDRIETQLKEVADECPSRPQCVDIDRVNNKVEVSAIFSWREKEFSTAYAEKAQSAFSSRSPIERAVLAFVRPKLLTTEREFLAKNQFQVTFRPYDWSLNDLTGRGGR